MKKTHTFEGVHLDIQWKDIQGAPYLFRLVSTILDLSITMPRESFLSLSSRVVNKTPVFGNSIPVFCVKPNGGGTIIDRKKRSPPLQQPGHRCVAGGGDVFSVYDSTYFCKFSRLDLFSCSLREFSIDRELGSQNRQPFP